MVTATQAGTQGCDDAQVSVTIQNYPFQFFSPYLSQAFVNKPIVETLPWEAPNTTGICP